MILADLGIVLLSRSEVIPLAKIVGDVELTPDRHRCNRRSIDPVSARNDEFFLLSSSVLSSVFFVLFHSRYLILRNRLHINAWIGQIAQTGLPMWTAHRGSLPRKSSPFLLSRSKIIFSLFFPFSRAFALSSTRFYLLIYNYLTVFRLYYYLHRRRTRLPPPCKQLNS